MNPEMVVRRASWIGFGVAGLYLASMLLSPVAGAAIGLLFLAFGWGIRQRQAWAATGTALFLTAPAFLLLLGQSGLGLGMIAAVGIDLVVALLPVAAAVMLWRHREMARFGRGWLAATIVLILAVTARLVDKQLYRNSAPVAEPYAIHCTSDIDPFRDNFPAAQPTVTLPALALEMLRNDVRNGELVVPPGRYFVLGDNRDNSLDSRYFGFVTRADVLASPLVIYSSYNVPEAAPQVTGTILNTRWNRLLRIL